MSYIGDIALSQTVDTKFCSVQSTGAPTTLAGSPVISAYVGNGTTEITAGITLTVDFDSRTGLNNVRVVASGANGYATATDVQLIITTGTVNSVSAIGYVVAEFSIENRQSNVKFWNGTAVATPATAGIPDVNVKNWNNLATVALPLTPTTAGRTLDVSAGGEAGVDWANVGSPTTALALTGTTVGTTTNLTNAPTAGDLTATMKTSIGTAVAASAVASVTAPVTVGTNNDKTGYALSAAGSAAMTEGYAAPGAAATLPQLLYMIQQMLQEFSITGTTLTVKKLDQSTSAATLTLNNATNPTAITRAT
jgi:hypothetical protein